MGGDRSERADQRKSQLILNATPLIYLCKSGLARHLIDLSDNFELLTTPEVYLEVYVQGMEKKVSEISVLKEIFEGGIVKVLPKRARESATTSSLSGSGLHPGELSVIRAALSLGATAIIDDKRARKLGRAVGARIEGTVSLILDLLRLEALDKQKARDAIETMINLGWYCSARDYAQIIKAVESI